MRYTDKQFLSPCYGESGSIVAEVESPVEFKEKEDDDNNMIRMLKSSWIDSTLGISDCSKKIYLDFSFDGDDDENFKKRLTKVENMINIISNFKQALIDAKEEYENLKKQATEGK